MKKDQPAGASSGDHTQVGKESAMKTTIAGLGLIAAASFGVVAAVPAPAMAADNNRARGERCHPVRSVTGPVSAIAPWGKP